MTPGEIHDDHPFATPPDLRDPVRRFRGRLAAPVTVVTAGSGEGRTGLTVSSLLVAEGEPSHVHFLLGPTTDLWHSISRTGAFIVHVAEHEHRDLSDVFALARPNPGGLFSGLEVTDTGYGPAIARIETRAYCRYTGHRSTGHYVLIDGRIEEIDLHDLRHPLGYFRGEYTGG